MKLRPATPKEATIKRMQWAIRHLQKHPTPEKKIQLLIEFLQEYLIEENLLNIKESDRHLLTAILQPNT